MRKKYLSENDNIQHQLIPEVIHHNTQEINITDGGEFLDDRIRISDPPPIYQTQTATETE